MMKLFSWRASSSNSTIGGGGKQKSSSSSSSCARIANNTPQKEERDDDGVVMKQALHSPDNSNINNNNSNNSGLTLASSSSSRMSTRSLTSVSDESAFSFDRHATAEEALYLMERGIALYNSGDVKGAQRCWEQVWEDLGTTMQLDMTEQQMATGNNSSNNNNSTAMDIPLRFVQSLRVKVLGYLCFSRLRHEDNNDRNNNKQMSAFYVSQLAALAKELGDYENDKYTVTDQLLFHLETSPQAEWKGLWNLLMEGQHWQLALQLATRRGGTTATTTTTNTLLWIDSMTLAKLYYKVALMGTDIDKALVCLTTCLSLLPSKKASTSTAALRRSALECLVELEATRRNYDSALEWHRKLLKALPPPSTLEKAKAQFQAVKAIDIPRGDLANAVSHLKRILKMLESDKTVEWFRLELLQVKASLEVQRCNWNAALADYQELLDALEHPSTSTTSTTTTTASSTSPDVLAKHYYMMGRISVKLSHYDDAIRYFSQELNITQEVVGAGSLAVSRILHELAAIYENGLGDNEKALEHYQEALRIEELVVQECRKPTRGRVSPPPPRRRRHGTTTTTTTSSSSTHGVLPRLQDALQQRRETQRCIGRIHYKRGDFDRALESSLPSGLPK